MKRILNILSGVVIVLFLIPAMCTERIEPGAIGVRRGLEGGVSDEDFEVGQHISIPFWHSWYQLDGTIHYLEFLLDEQTALDLRTRENNNIYIDVTIPYRIKTGEAHKIVKEGILDSYPAKVESTTVGVLRDQLGMLSNLDVQKPEKRQEVALTALPALNAALAQYHVEATHVIIRGIRFRDVYEQKLQNKQYFIVQGRLDAAREKELLAKQNTETLEKTIVKDVALRRESWNKKIEELKADFEVQISEIQAEATIYSRQRHAAADALFAEMESEGNLAEAMAQALGEKLKAQALASKAGRTFSAIEAARRFQLGDIQLNSTNPTFLYEFGSMKAWRRFFSGE